MSISLLAVISVDAQDYPVPVPGAAPEQMAPPQENIPAPQGGEAGPGNSDGAVTFQTFYDALASDGKWFQTPDYGYVWQPQVTDPNWAPYTVGHWVYTNDGWTWASDEPWGWATYHYGRWVNLDGVGWCWVPGYTWGPAWVSWRYGDGYCGWAPLPPDSLVGVDYDAEDEADSGFHIGGDCDDYYGLGPGWYNFLPVVYFGDTDYRGYYANRYDNYRLISHTTNVTNLNVTRRGGESDTFSGVSLGGPSLRQMDAVSQTPVERVNLAYTNRTGGGAVTGGTFQIFAPRVDAASQVRPQFLAGSVSQAVVNRGTDIAHPLLVNSRLGASAPTELQVQQARRSEASAPAEAKLATMNMPVRSASATPVIARRPAAVPFAGPSTRSRNFQAYPGTSQRPSAPTYARPGGYPAGGGGYRAPSPAPGGYRGGGPGGGNYSNGGDQGGRH
jgi:hypothetical protein